MSKLLRGLFLGTAVICLIIAGLGAILLTEVRRPAGEDATPVEFVVESGDSTTTIAGRLREAGLLRQPLLFGLLVRLQGADGKLQAGRYLLNETMTMSQLISALQNSRVEEVQVRIVEGLRIEEIAEIIDNAGLVRIDGQIFLDTVRNGEAFKAGHFYLNSLPDNASLEGYLFPDTYRFAATATVTEVVETMLDTFDARYATIERDVRVPNVQLHQVVTMASIVQREAAQEEEMATIAAVFWNRLKPERSAEVGGRLGADPTVQYALASERGPEGGWWPKLDTLTLEQINGVPGPYNTRTSAGLPPGPIASPGLAALTAAAQPDESAEYLYFVAACGRPGEHNFAVTFPEFQRFEQEYLTCPRS